MHSTEMKQTESCSETKLDTDANTEISSKTTEQIKRKRQRSPVRLSGINKDINENKTKDIAIKNKT